ncbi:hypothetical protein [Nocardioides albus]|uniref:Uncharacterized protein n=1 Tax=Nocardioides albus TaxID=1841 RepID=A0A7W5F7C6_9ACTN|nr:hypothetical protein [Nocardioides albus]MBB3087732.1 hypothetical protein [Nocardioides albus]GGU11057.1 hypothetical protein GCM10007979_06560 [Nocardioides albus]
MSSATYAPVTPPHGQRRGGTLAAIVLGLLGAPLLLVGSGLAIATGPDDVMVGKETPIAQGAAYSTPEAFAFDQLPVTVRVQGSGETYIGVGNPVDVLDVVEDTNAVEIAKTPLTRVSGTAGSGEPVPDASGAPWWHESVSGTGTQELKVTLAGEPVSFLAASRNGTPIKLSFGYRLDGLFATALVGAGLGTLLVLGAVLLLRAGRGRRDQWEPPQMPPVRYAPHALMGAIPTAPTVAVPSGPVPGPAQRPPAPGLYRRLRTAAGIGVLGLGLAGCSMPASVELATASKVSMQKKAVDEVIADWNKRNNKAIKANQPGKWKAEAWAEADSGPVLAKDQLASAAGKGFDLQDRAPTWVAVPGRVWSVQLSEYPMWAVVEVEVKGDKKAKLTRMAVYEQQDALSPWKVRSSLAVRKKVVPPEIEGAAPASPEAMKQVQDLAGKIDAYLEKPRKGKKRIAGLGGSKALADPGSDIAAYAADMGVDMVKTTAEPFDETSTRVVQTPDGVLAILDFTVDSTVGGQDGEWEWNPPYDEFRSRAGKNLSIRTAVTVALTVPNQGDPTVIGVDYGEIMGAKVQG